MLRTGPNGAKTGIGLNITNLFDPDAVFPSMRSRGYATAIFVSASIEFILLLATTRACRSTLRAWQGKIHNAQADWLCSPDNHSEPFDHVETECSPCGGYYRTGADQWISKDRHDSPHVFETLQPGDPFSNYSE